MEKIIDNEDFKFVKNSLKHIDKSEREWAEDLIDYIEMSSTSNEDEFFYDMMLAIRFVKENNTLAYTTPDKRIWLNAPGLIGKKLPPWDFTYDHECLHQLWESFDVIDEIKSKGIEYDHDLFNIASDCVINTYLRDNRGKTPPDGIIFPETIKKDFGVDYDPSKDTQFTLYMKLLATGKKAPSSLAKMANPKQGQGNQGGQSGQGGSSGQRGGQSGQGGQGGQQGHTPEEIDKMSKDEAKQAAQEAADRAQRAADRAKDQYGAGSEEAQEAQEAADRAKAAAGKAKRARSENGARKAAKEAEEAAQEAEAIAGSEGQNGQAGKPNELPQGDDSMIGKGQKHNQSGGDWGSGTYLGGDEADKDLDDLERKELDKITRYIDGCVKKYASKIAGAFGNFVKQCKFSKEMRPTGLAAPATKAKANWKQMTYKAIGGFIKNKVFQKKREWKRTYSRPKRGSGIVRMGEPIEMGRIPKDDKMNIPIAFYLDKSGSMYSTIDRAASAMYSIAKEIKHDWFKEKVINEIDFSYFAFDVSMHELKTGQVPPASDDNMTLADILQFIATRPKKDLINIIITDGQYSIDDAKMAQYFKDYDGLMVMVINNVNNKMKNLENKFPNKFIYVQADSQFTV